MYLFVFVLLMVSILGTYMHAYLLQVAHSSGSQTSIAQVMVAWHRAAYRLAVDNASAIPNGQTYCYLTPSVTPACSVTVPDPTTSPYLPSGYNYTTYKWYSILYQNASTEPRRLITYVLPASDPSQPITKPLVGYSAAEIFQELKNAGLDTASYGTISGSTLNTMLPLSTSVLTFSMPAALGKTLDGAVALISSP